MGYRMSGRFTHNGKAYRFRSWLTDDPELPEVRLGVKEVGVRRTLRFLHAEPASEEVQIEEFKYDLDLMEAETEEVQVACQYCGKPVPNGQEKYHADGVCHSNGG